MSTNGAESWVTVTLGIPSTLLKQWRQEAKDCSLSLDEWLLLNIERARVLRLAERTPGTPLRIDPRLAEAIREGAKGQPWEHKALALVGTAEAEDPRRRPADLAATLGRRPHELTVSVRRRLAEHGLAGGTGGRRSVPVWARCDKVTLSWLEAYLLLRLWDVAGRRWVSVDPVEIATEAQVAPGIVEGIVEGLVAKALLDENPARPLRHPFLRISPPLADRMPAALLPPTGRPRRPATPRPALGP
jgi:hypothetical protein